MKTGIPKLDDMFGPEMATNLLIYSTPGVEDTTFAQNILMNNCKKGYDCFYMINNKGHNTVKQMLSSFYKNSASLKKECNFTFIDCYSWLIGKSEVADGVISLSQQDPNYLNKIIKILEKSKNKNKVLLIDSLSSYIDFIGNNAIVLENISKLISLLKDKNIFVIALFVDWGYDKKIVDNIKNLFVNIVNLKPIERKVILTNYFSVSKKKGKKNGKIEVPFKILKPGGVRIYIPKILVTGPFNAGKTSFVHSASNRFVSVDRLGTTVALDHGHVDYAGFAVDLFGTPGQERFDPILNFLSGEALGIIVVVDSTNPNSFVRAKEMLDKTKTKGLPYVIAANKSNLPGALSPGEIRKKMNLENTTPIIKLEAKDLKKVIPGKPCELKEEGIKLVLDTLFKQIIR